MAKTVALPEGITSRNAERFEHLRWINEAAAREHNRIVGIRRFGFGLDSRIRIEFENGQYVSVRQRDLLGASGLRNTLMLFDGGLLPPYSASDSTALVARIIWASEASIREDELHQLIDDVGEFLTRSLREAGVVRHDYSANGYRMIADLLHVNLRRDGGRGTPAPALGYDVGADALWIPRHALAAYLREVRHRLDPSTLRAELEQLGWQAVEFQRRQPTSEGRPKIRVWVVDADWQGCPFDLKTAVGTAPDAR